MSSGASGALDPTSAMEADLAAAREGDSAAFSRLVAPMRRQLHAHCYRMLGSIYDADDAVQDALLRAWRGLPAFEGRSSLSTWLFTVATRVCLDLTASHGRRVMPMDLSPSSNHAVLDSAPATEIRWITPYPDADPHDRAERRETLELAFVAALQRLPGNQRAALLLFDVLGFRASEIAEVMDTTTASVNSALSRARRSLGADAPSALDPTSAGGLDAHALRHLARRYATALEQGDIDAFVSLLTDDVTWTMPPLATWYRGIAAVADFALEVPITRCPSWHHVVMTANGRPAVASYLGAEPDGVHEAWSITVLTPRADRIAAITTFIDPALFSRFHLAPVSAQPEMA